MPEEDPLRQKLQLIIAVVLVAVVIALPTWYVIEKGITADDQLVVTIITGAWTLAVAGAGAAFAIFGLGRKVT